MKTFVALLALFAAANAQDVDCGQCKELVIELGKFLIQPSEIDTTILLLQDLVCANEPDDEQAGCSQGIEERWPKIAQGLFTYPDTPGDVCAAVGICKKKDIFRAGVSCDICKAGLVLVTDVLANNDDFANMVVENVKDPIYCSGEADVQACNDFVDKYGVKAIKALGAALPGEIDRICSPPQCE